MSNQVRTARPQLARRAFLTLGAASLATTLAGCFTGRPPITYDLAALAPSASGRRTGRTVLITEPESIQIYDTDRIVVREAGSVLSYLPQAQWSDRLPRLVETRLVQSFQDAGVTNIGRRTDPLDPDLLLNTDIRAFEIDVGVERVASVSITARLVDDWDRRVVATQTFATRVPVAALDAPNAVPALNQALATVIGELIGWTIARA